MLSLGSERLKISKQRRKKKHLLLLPHFFFFFGFIFKASFPDCIDIKFSAWCHRICACRVFLFFVFFSFIV